MVWPGDVLHDIESEVEKMKKDRLEITEKVKARKTQRQVRLLTAHKGIPALSTAGPKLAEAKLGQSHRVFPVCPEILEEAGPTPWATPAPSSVSLPVVQRLEWAKSQQTSDSDLLLVSDGRNKELREKMHLLGKREGLQAGQNCVQLATEGDEAIRHFAGLPQVLADLEGSGHCIVLFVVDLQRGSQRALQKHTDHLLVGP